MAGADRPRLHAALLGHDARSPTGRSARPSRGTTTASSSPTPTRSCCEYDPYRRLSYTWHTFTPELAERFDFATTSLAKLAAERRSTVTFDLEPVDAMVKLTVVHDDFDADSTAVDMVSEGWPRVLSDLKTMLETQDLPTRSAAT